MAKSPNTDPFNNTWSYDWSWTQPYVSMNDFFQGKECREIYEALSVEQELDALELARELEVDHLEAVMRAEIGQSVSRLSIKELKREAYRLAKVAAVAVCNPVSLGSAALVPVPNCP